MLAFNGSGQLTARYLNGPNLDASDQYYTTLAEEDVTSLNSPGTVTFDLLDPQGSVVDVVNSNGNVADHIVYGPFGAVAYESNPSILHLTSWQGGLLDAATGLENFDHRWYVVADGFWASEDPLGFFAGDTNLTRFVINDPTSLTDPTGLEGVVIDVSHGGGSSATKDDSGFGQPTEDMPDQGELPKGVTGTFNQSGDTGSVTIYFKGGGTCNTISGALGQATPTLRSSSGTYSGGMLTASLKGYPPGTYKVTVRWGASLTSSCTSQPVRLQGLWLTTPNGKGGFGSTRLTGDPSPGACLNKPVEFGGTTTVTVTVGPNGNAPVIQLEPGAIRGRNDDPPLGSPVGTRGACCTTVYNAYLQVLSVTPVVPPAAPGARPPAPARPSPSPRPITPFGPYPATPPGFPPGTHGV